MCELSLLLNVFTFSLFYMFVKFIKNFSQVQENIMLLRYLVYNCMCYRTMELQLCYFQDVSNMSNMALCPLRVGLTILDPVGNTAPKSPKYGHYARKRTFLLRICLVNPNKSAVSWKFVHIYNVLAFSFFLYSV